MKFIEKKLQFCSMIEIAKLLYHWYLKNKRDLPWRDTQNPYYIWVSEIILQQTRVEQGLPYYQKFIEYFPTIKLLAEANEREVLSVWKGLGYYRRALNMHQAAKYVLNDCNGQFPQTYNELLKLKGVGEYTAAAIASIAFNEKTPVVDGNVIRVMSRVFMLDGDKNNLKFKRQLAEMIKPSMDFYNPSVINQGLMELGALVCLPQKPTCSVCPINAYCKAYKANKIQQYPTTSEKVKQKAIYFNYLIITDFNHVLMQLRKDDDIWKNMYQFPLIEADKNFHLEELTQNTQFKKLFPRKMVFLYESKIYKHILSHRIIYAKFFIFKLIEGDHYDFEKFNIQELDKLPLPRLIEKIKNDLVGLNDYLIKKRT